MQDTLLLKTVENYLRQLNIQRDDGMIVAVSGGADSMALLTALREVQCDLPFRMVVAHVHHGLRGEEADRDASFVKSYCAEHHIPFELLQASVAEEAQQGEGIEQAGRRIRYAFFEQLRSEYGYRYIATAHTASDNLETVLLHLTRGSGLHGLCGIAPINGHRIRPLLTCSREEVERFCRDNAVAFVDDSSNFQSVYSRNRIRHEVVTQLKLLNPQVVDACTRMTARLREEDAFLDGLATELLSSAATENGYAISLLQAAAPCIRRRAVKRLAEQEGGDPEEKHILLMEQMLMDGHGAVQMPCGVQMSLSEGHVTVSASHVEEFPYFEQELEIGVPCIIGDMVYTPLCLSIDAYTKKQKVHKKVLQYACDYDKIAHTLVARQRKIGDAFHPVGGVGKTLKKYFNEKKVPASKRQSIPILADANGIVLVAGYSCDDRVKLDENTKQVFVFCNGEC